MGHLSLSFLGTFTATLDGKPVSGFDSNKVRALLAYLAVEDEYPHRRESLATLLWGEFPENTARTNLRNALANLRKVLSDQQSGQPFILVTYDTLQFNRDSDAYVDVTTINTLINNPNPTIQQLEQAVNLYQGNFLQGFTLKDSFAFDDWTLIMRERLHRRMLTALGNLATHYAEQSEFAKACQLARKQVEMEPWNEETHRNLMYLLAASGQHSAALTQYETCWRLLDEEFGVTPSRETKELYAQVRDGQFTKGRLSLKDKPIVPLQPKHNLPAQLTTSFIGRKDEMNTIMQRLEDPACRLLTLVGPGGCGKTRLAIEVGRDAVDRFKQGVVLIPLAPVKSADGLVSDLANIFNLSFAKNMEPRKQILNYLANKNLLLIFDSCEHLLVTTNQPSVKNAEDNRSDGHSVITFLLDILKNSPDVQIIITSRTRLHCQNEYVLSIPGMSYPDLSEIKQDRLSHAHPAIDLTQYSAVNLFVQNAVRVCPDFTLTPANQLDVVRICQLVDGMPLGILLASTWMYVVSPGDIADKIQQNLDALESDSAAFEERQRSLRSVFDQSWNLLASSEQNLLKSLSYFRGKFSLIAAQAVTEANLPALRKMIDKSLLNRHPSGYYEMHEVVRTYAEERLLRDSGLMQAIRKRHNLYYISALEQWWVEMMGPRQEEALQEVGNELENVRLAWPGMMKLERILHLRNAYMAVMFYFGVYRRFREAEVWFRETVKQVEKVLEDDLSEKERYKVTRIQALMVACHVYADMLSGGDSDRLQRNAKKSRDILNDLEQANQDIRWEKARVICTTTGNLVENAEELRLALAISQEIDDAWGKAWAFENLGWSYLHLGDYDRAKNMWQQCLVIGRRLGCPLLIYTLLSYLGYAAWETGDYFDAERMWEETLNHFRASKKKFDHSHSNALQCIANIHLLKGQLDIAEALVRECIEISREIGDTFTIMVGFRRLGLTYLASGQYECAQDAFTESIELCGVNKNNVEMCNSGTRLCLARLHTGRYRQAQNLIKEYKKSTENSGFTRNISLCYLLLGHLALVNTQYTDAQEQTQKGIDILESIGPRRELGPAYADLCLASLRLGDPIQAKHHLHTALDYAVETGDYVAHVYVLPITALYFMHQGQEEHGRDLYIYANTFPMVANSRWFADILKPGFGDLHPPSAVAYTPALETDEALHALHAKVRDIRQSLA